MLSKNASDVAKARYFRKGLISNENWSDDSWESVSRRVARSISSNEKDENKGKYEELFYEMISSLKALPGGRTLRNAGFTDTLLNCHVLQLGDSMVSTPDVTGIGRFIDMALTLNSEGGGVGCNPRLRPKGAPIKGKGGVSTGLLSFLDAISYVLNTVESGGNRRSGMLPIVDVTHPELVDFIDSKLDQFNLNNFNISVGITNDFLDAVEQKKKWTFMFDGVEYGEMWAPDIFDKIIHNMIESGEPGLVNLDKMRTNNSWYFSPVESLNLCGELPLSKGQSCCLGSIVLPSFLDSSGRTKWQELSDTVKLLVRFLDDVLDINKYSFEEMRLSTMKTRRIGIGVMGLADYLFAKEAVYGSERGLSLTEEIIRTLRNEIYTASIELAKEKGSFSGFNDFAYTSAKFVKTLPARIRMDIKKYGIRNCTMMAFAPTGSISLIPETTSGIEPLFSKAYTRHDRVSNRVYIHPLYKEIIKNNRELPKYFVDAFDLTPEQHFETTVAVQKYNDGSISKTQNLPKGTTPEQLKDWVLEYARDLVGITVYVDGSRDDQILVPMSREEAIDYIKNDQTHPLDLNIEEENNSGCGCGA
jgi:ribonucleoside-diphosphate reductase alpha chain